LGSKHLKDQETEARVYNGKICITNVWHIKIYYQTPGIIYDTCV